MDSFKIYGIGMICALICVLIKHQNSSFVVPTRVAGLIMIYAIIIALISPLMDYLSKLMEITFSLEYVEIIVKALCIAYVSQITSDICKDCGEATLASALDTVGKIEILILSLPLIDKMIKLSEEMIL